jgi:hypothetical protein
MASILKVDTIQDQAGNNIINESADTITIGATAITIDSSENVGIGTASPDTILHIASGSSGASPASGTHLFLESSGDTQLCISSPNANSSQIRFGSPSDASGAIISYDDTNNKFTFGGSSANTFLTFNTGGAIVERMRIDSSGNVCIGTSSSGQKVAIAVDDNNTGIGNGTQNLELSNINGTNNTYSRILFNDTVGGAGAGIFGLKLTDTANNYGQFEFWTRGSSGGNTRMVIDPNGNVGIGTSSSNEKMQLNSSGSTFLQLTTTTTGTANNNGLYVGVNSLGEGFVGLRDTNGNPLIFQTENTERMRITSSGNVGIGTTSPGAELDVLGGILSPGEIRITNAGGSTIDEDPIGKYSFYTTDASGIGAREIASIRGINGESGTTFAGELGFYTSPFNSNVAEAMRIDKNGRVLIGTTSAGRFDRETLEVKNTTGEAILAQTNGLSYAGFNYKSLQSTGGTHYIAWFENSSGTNVGEITHNNSSTSYVTTSDYRLKENVSYDFDATTRLKQLKPARFNFIADANTTVDGFLAHEVSSIVPEAISGEKDAVDEDGNPQYQGIDQSKLVPLLVKTIQELEARITALETQP